MHFIGKINNDVYKCITENIVTDDVIITDERVQHIKENHPEDYEKFSEYLTSLVENPDYIIETNKPNSGIVLKEITGLNNKQFKAVIRLTTEEDNKNFKNSIITFMKIDKKEWNRLIRNKTILYRK